MQWILPAILFALTCCHEQAELIQPRPAPVVPGIASTVVSNHDGDSLTVVMNGQKVKVRIEGIDAPERSFASMASSSPRFWD